MFLLEKIDENINNQKFKKYNYKNINYYDFTKLDYYKLNIFNKLNNLFKTFYI